jgi:5-hydroxyisourate hydrolase
MGKLTTHVLDLTRGIPAAGMRIELRALQSAAATAAATVLADLRTNEDGRAERPLLEGASLQVGRYALVFHVADYFRNAESQLSEPPFLDEVVVQFGVADAEQNYHVPLLVTPWGYSTYRGS